MIGIRTVHRRLRRRNDERGLVLVYFALMLTVLMVSSAFVVDIGAWTTRGQEIQRTADAAALAGVAWMPGNFAQAEAAAIATAQRNGFNATQVSVSAVSGYSERLKVTITDPNVHRWFSNTFASGDITMARTGTAEYLPTVRMGSPTNQLGTGTTNGGAATNVWNAVSGWCTPKESGDRYSPAYDGEYMSGTYTCPGTPIVDNAELNGLGSRGYTYDFEVPSAANRGTFAGDSIVFEAFDPSFDPYWITSTNTQATCPTAPNIPTSPDQSVPTARLAYHITTYYEITDPSGNLVSPSYTGGTNPIVYDSNEVGQTIPAQATGHGDSAHCGWQNLVTLPSSAAPGQYKVRVYTASNQPNSFGVNAFGLQARYSTQPQTGGSADCGSDSGMTINGLSYKNYCINIHGQGAMTAMTITGHDVAGSTKKFYLAAVPPNYANQTMTITIWDPGDGASASNKIQLLDPSSKLTAYNWSVDAPCGTKPLCGGVTDTNGLETWDTATTQPHSNLFGTSIYNDHLLTITVSLPNNYSVPAGNPNGWWMLQYTYDGSGTPLQDLTTWTVAVSGKPVHLVNG